jgi:hypothetical protein
VLAAAALAAARAAIEFWRDSRKSTSLSAVLRRAIQQVVGGTTREDHAT